MEFGPPSHLIMQDLYCVGLCNIFLFFFLEYDFGFIRFCDYVYACVKLIWGIFILSLIQFMSINAFRTFIIAQFFFIWNKPERMLVRLVYITHMRMFSLRFFCCFECFILIFPLICLMKNCFWLARIWMMFSFINVLHTERIS